MKRAFSTLACMELRFDELLATAGSHGMSGLEVRLDREEKICGLGVDDGPLLRQMCADAGVVITDLATGVSVSDDSEAQLAKAKVCVDMANAAGCSAIRIFVGAMVPRFTDKAKESEDGIVRFLRKLCPYAAGKKVAVWLETHSTYSTGAAIRRLIDKTGESNLYALWDLIHTIEYGEDPAETLAILGDRLAHVHLKDGVFSGDRNKTAYVHTALGEGEMPLAYFLRLLHRASYNGYLSLEWELPWRPELQSCYPDTDATLAAYNRWLDMVEGNILPLFTEDGWQPFTPENRALASFEKASTHLSIDLASHSYGVGKWLCEVPVIPGQSYAFQVTCETSEAPNDVYVLLTQKKADGKWLIREHALDCVRKGSRLFFSDTIAMEPEAVAVQLELWCKGKLAAARWYQPTLSPCAPLPERHVKIAIAYLKPTPKPNLTLTDNKEVMAALADTAGESHPDIILFGECMYDRGVRIPFAEKVETDRGIMCTLMAEKAARYHCYLIYNFHEADGGEYYNTSILFDRNGNKVGKYRKTHLTVSELEQGMTPGEEYPVFDTDFGRIGMLTCWDHYFTATAEALVDKGAEILFVPSAGDAAEKCIARAMDTGVYVAVCGMNKENTHDWGPARVVSPLGEILAHGETSGEPVFCEIDLNKRIRRFWLSVGPADSYVKSVYKYEKNPKSFLE